MTKGELIEQRLQQKQCIKCGLHPAIDWPYLCNDCLKAAAIEHHVTKHRDGHPKE